MQTKHDIRGIEDIKLMVDEFYAKVQKDELLAPIFNFRLSTHWTPHLEKMYTFWNAALFGVKGYNGNPFMKHATMEINEEHFKHWLNLFNETIDANFEGPTAEDAKKRGMIMANMFQIRLKDLESGNKKPIF
ncbi:group III truncated hemoglobin [Daejeonella oryzae]|uniref:group III truncated hemoglobin n=1 Tax=Daejeonella oryzae TaxID=1122943 RepID=UPI000408EAA1|nr:group III truncated hemoglobin [Daejeonella oryzae]